MNISNENHGHGCTNETKILYRAPQMVQGEGWTISIRDIGPEQRGADVMPSLACACACCTCVMAGTQILLADGSTAPIESFVGGEMVRTLTGTAKVLQAEQVVLGYTRKIIELAGPNGQNLFVTDDHPLWTRFADQTEWWGTFNFNQYLVEKGIGLGTRLKTDAVPLRFDVPQTVAHADGWRHVQPIYHMMAPETPVYHIAVENGGSYIANGFVVTSYCRDEDVKGVSWTGLHTDCAASKFVEECCSSAA